MRMLLVGTALAASCVSAPGAHPGPAANDSARVAEARPHPIEDSDTDLFPEPGSRTEFRLNLVEAAITRFMREHQTMPRSLDELYAGRAHEPDPTLDAWGQKIRFSPTTSGYELRSSGKDRVFGTGDDVVLTHRV